VIIDDNKKITLVISVIKISVFIISYNVSEMFCLRERERERIFSNIFCVRIYIYCITFESTFIFVNILMHVELASSI
jgi:hypothetical protein